MRTIELAGDLYPQVLQLARLAGERILSIYKMDFAIEQKADRSPLTLADLEAHRILKEGLAKLPPGWPVLSEEGTEIPWSERRTWTCYWLIDPLDGTREFVKRNGEFTVNVALIENGEPIFGVVHAPALEESYFGLLGVGAFFSRHENPWRRLHCVSAGRALPRVLASRSHGDARLEHFLAQLGPHERLGLGSSLKFAHIASGEADVYVRLGPTCEWDTAAGQCVLEAAGGAVTSLDFNRLQYNQKPSLHNPFFVAFGDRNVLPDRIEMDAGPGLSRS
ncbi:sulfite synthesis pathway protein [mine drainage metagenome]|uniref:3'-phosphoadenosine 5'-phosphate phosphatase n=2 Tax=mine drainage metagenome TaxID=410659 RepID=T1BGL6_9ZZZZ